MAVEARRGCGYRKAGGLYLVASAVGEPCERLPIPILPCTVCGSGLKPMRSWQWVRIGYILEGARTCAGGKSHCPRCPVCSPDLFEQTADPKDRVGLLWCGEAFYPNPGDWMAEAGALGISRRISALPKGFIVGKTWVMIAHRKAIGKVAEDGKTMFTPGVFHVFRPERIELVVTPSMKEEAWVAELVEKGVTLIEVPEDDPDHLPVKRQRKTRREAAADRRAVRPPVRPPEQLKLFEGQVQ
jgi:hypothetical protein